MRPENNGNMRSSSHSLAETDVEFGLLWAEFLLSRNKRGRDHRTQVISACAAPEMHSESIRLSIAILKAVLAGEAYGAVAAAHRLTRTAIEHRVKRLARVLQRKVGIDGLNPEAAGYLHKLRAARDEVEAAIERFEAGDLLSEAPPQALSDKDVETMIHRAGLRSPTPLRDRALIHIVLATGARPLEVARLAVSDYLDPDGSIRACSVMRAAVSVNRKARPLFFRSTAAVEAIDAYLASRLVQRDKSSDGDAPYRGFVSGDRLFLNDAGQAYVVHHSETAGRSNFLCRQILDTYRRIFKRIDMHGFSALALRRTVAFRLAARGADEAQIGLILGITEKQAVRGLLPRRPELYELMTELYTDADLPKWSL
jgi:site-specific recombinase XerD